ncbi:MAG: PPK2 family polyphosphate kinase [Acidimicrobiales bacterium]
MTADRERFVLRPGRAPGLDRVDTRSTGGAPGDKAVVEAGYEATWARLSELQERLYAESRRSLLVVLQALDAGGKDGTIGHVFRGLNPQGVRVTPFKAPTPQELAHDFLWRAHAAVPAQGEIAVFNRSHYEDVLVVRVKDIVAEAVWRARYDHIRAFEANLVDAGTTIVKVFLHISRDEQRERLQARLDDPAKHWKFNVADLEDRARWPAYEAAFEEAIAETSTAGAPWYVVPADRKWYRNWAIGRILVETLEHMNPQFPAPEAPLDGITVK